MRIDPVSGMPSEVERPATTGAVTAAATEINVHSNADDAPVTAVADVQKDIQAAPNGRGETVWLEKEKRQVYRIVDERNGEVVCQVPSDEVLRVARNLEDLARTEQKTLDIKS
jgi:uncharacterized FlaG/YvyC family protein